MKHLSAEELNDVFLYRDGRLFWKIKPCPRVKLGAEVGSPSQNGYWKVGYKGKILLRHRIIYAMHTNTWPAIVDHVDQNKSNDQFENLRAASNSLNVHNSGASWGSDPYRGVCYHKQEQKYRARIQIAGERKTVGYFNSPEEAFKAYAEYKQIHTAHLV